VKRNPVAHSDMQQVDPVGLQPGRSHGQCLKPRSHDVWRKSPVINILLPCLCRDLLQNRWLQVGQHTPTVCVCSLWSSIHVHWAHTHTQTLTHGAIHPRWLVAHYCWTLGETCSDNTPSPLSHQAETLTHTHSHSDKALFVSAWPVHLQRGCPLSDGRQQVYSWTVRCLPVELSVWDRCWYRFC